MKAVMIQQPGSVLLTETPLPEPPPGFARVRVKAAAICATDLEVVDGNIAANYPLIPGHEWSGVVDSVGSSEDQHWVGKRVIGSNDVVCLRCDACGIAINLKKSGSNATALTLNMSLFRYMGCANWSSRSLLKKALCASLWA